MCPPFTGRSVRRLALAGLSAVWVLSILGCLSFSFGSRTEVAAQNQDGVVAQTGKASVPANAEVEVFYPRGYAGPPNLTFTDSVSQRRLVQQRPDGFVVRNTSAEPLEVEWHTRGQPATPAVGGAAPAGVAQQPSAAVLATDVRPAALVAP